jgi:hypothetical protein
MNAFFVCRRCCPVLFLACFCLAGTGRGDPTMPVPPFEARYAVTRTGIPVGEAVLQLEYEDAARYRMRSSLDLNSLASLMDARSEREEVEGEFVGGMPRPLRYRAQRTGSKARTTSMDFDWGRGMVTTVFNGKKSCLRLGPQTVDPLSLHLLTMLNLQSGTLADEYEAVGRDRLKVYLIQSLGETTIRAPIGVLTALAVSRQRPQSKKTTTFWYAPELDFLPVQVTRTKDGTEKSRLTIDRLKR